MFQIEAALDEYGEGSFKASKFRVDPYKPIYDHHIKQLNAWRSADIAKSTDTLGDFQRKLMSTARYFRHRHYKHPLKGFFFALELLSASTKMMMKWLNLGVPNVLILHSTSFAEQDSMIFPCFPLESVARLTVPLFHLLLHSHSFGITVEYYTF